MTALNPLPAHKAASDTLHPCPMPEKLTLAKATMNDAGEWVYEDRALARVGDQWLEDQPVRCKTCGRWNCTHHQENVA